MSEVCANCHKPITGSGVTGANFARFCSSSCKNAYEAQLKAAQDQAKAMQQQADAMSAAQRAQEQAAMAAAARERQAAKAEKKQAKIAEKAQKEAIKERKEAKKEEKKQKALENSKITSDESLAKTFKLCLVGGYIGVHDFALGKLKTGIIKAIIAIYVVYITIVKKDPSFLMFLLINIAWWGIDLIRIKSGKFTDKYGYSIRN